MCWSVRKNNDAWGWVRTSRVRTVIMLIDSRNYCSQKKNVCCIFDCGDNPHCVIYFVYHISHVCYIDFVLLLCITGAANTLRNGFMQKNPLLWLFLFDHLISWWCCLVDKVVKGSYRGLRSWVNKRPLPKGSISDKLNCTLTYCWTNGCKTFITLKKVGKTLLFSLKRPSSGTILKRQRHTE